VKKGGEMVVANAGMNHLKWLLDQYFQPAKHGGGNILCYKGRNGEIVGKKGVRKYAF